MFRILALWLLTALQTDVSKQRTILSAVSCTSLSTQIKRVFGEAIKNIVIIIIIIIITCTFEATTAS
jgi:hypothetical protein